MNNMVIEQVEETKLLGVTLDCNPGWSKHIDTTVAKMGRSLSTIKRCSAFSTIHKAGPTGLSFAAPGILFSCVVKCHKVGLGKLQLA
jgi:hypothetical protein